MMKRLTTQMYQLTPCQRHYVILRELDVQPLLIKKKIGHHFKPLEAMQRNAVWIRVATWMISSLVAAS